jgi:hypothetical protein
MVVSWCIMLYQGSIAWHLGRPVALGAGVAGATDARARWDSAQMQRGGWKSWPRFSKVLDLNGT